MEVQKIIKRNQEKGSSSYSYATLAEAEEKAGFKIKVPSYLPKYGGKVPSRIYVGNYTKDIDGKLVDTGKHNVYMRFDSGKDSFQGLMLMISEIGMEVKPGFKYEVVNVGGKDARWYDSEIMLKDGGDEPHKVIERALSWEEGGMTYLLNDYSGLSKEELVKIVESMK